MKKENYSELFAQIDRLTLIAEEMRGMSNVLDEVSCQKSTMTFLEQSVTRISRDLDDIADTLLALSDEEYEGPDGNTGRMRGIDWLDERINTMKESMSRQMEEEEAADPDEEAADDSEEEQDV